MRIEDTWKVIVNPNAGRKRGARDWKQISRLLREAHITFEADFTKHREHAPVLTQTAIEQGFRNFLVVGGDGTLNEVVNGIFGQVLAAPEEFVLGLIPVGTGNDWGRMYRLNVKYKKAIKAIRKQRIFIQDTGRVNYYVGSREISRYFVNIAGLGYDALVTRMTNQTKESGAGGTLDYLVNLLKGLVRYKNAYHDIHVDGERVYKGKVFSMSAGICKYNGGGMMQLPFAIPDDGLLDVTIFKRVTTLTVIRNLKNLYSGTFTNLPFVQTHTGRAISIISSNNDQSQLETDGESLGQTPVLIDIIPKSLTVITGKHWKNED